MGQQADAVRSTNALDMRLRCHEGFHDLELAEHGRGKYRWSSALRDQILGYRPVAHVRGCAQRRFPVAEAPVPGRARQRWTRAYQFLHPFQVKVRDQDHLPHQLRRLRGEDILYRQRHVSIVRAFESKAPQQPADRLDRKNGSRKLQNVSPRMNTDHGISSPVLRNIATRMLASAIAGQVNSRRWPARKK